MKPEPMIKLELPEDYVEEIQRLNQLIKNLKEENQKLSTENACLKHCGHGSKSSPY